MQRRASGPGLAEEVGLCVWFTLDRQQTMVKGKEGEQVPTPQWLLLYQVLGSIFSPILL